jgi:DNA-binding NarL/FixJ family response regulator
MPVTVSIVEDHQGTRESLVALLKAEPSMKCLGAHGSGEAAVKAIPIEKPDVAIVDINLPGMSGIECVARLKTQMPSLQLLMLTTYQQSDIIFDSLRAGASGYLLKNMSHSELIQAVEQVHAGGAPMSTQIARKVVEHFRSVSQPSSEVDRLSPREQEVLAMLAKGFLYKEIGDNLGITLNTVRMHLRHIYEKLHVRSRTEATVKFLGGDAKAGHTQTGSISSGRDLVR